MKSLSFGRALITLYMVAFLLYLVLPLLIMGGASLNDSRFPSIYPWAGLTSRWFVDLFNDGRMWHAVLNTVVVAMAVVVLSVPVGAAGAILINGIGARYRTVLYGLMVAPILTPGAVIGISTLLFWNKFNVPAGLHLSVLGQVSYIAAYSMLLVLARLQSFDRGLEEAALDLGASHGQVLRRILLPHLYPALIAAAVIGFFQSVENFNVTLFTAGATGNSGQTLTVYVYGRVRSGITPTINALALILILTALAGVLTYEILRRSRVRVAQAEAEAAAKAEKEELARISAQTLATA